MREEENNLIRKVIQGDLDSFENLIRDYQVYAYNIAYRILGNEEDAKDATQESLIKVYKSINKFEMESSFSTWMYRIVVNTCKDELRKKGDGHYSLDKEISIGDGKIMVEVADNSFNPARIYEENEVSGMVQKAIEKLPEDNKIVIILRDIQGLTYEEISESIIVPIGTVKSRIARGRMQLKNALLGIRELYTEELL